ncbi:39S ribosomal protein L17, mitochondrial [Intoshia linei]|uniref:Large ribosomal subunit protein bL17m n=1 Tax=Intoshia linei TaxID=1819745 RepID=A0A177B8G7_9BILA|nr:39S ribosomal protein L17, mitochondrial [Intoshia linei]
MSSLSFRYAKKMLPMKRTHGLGSGLSMRMVKLKELVSSLYRNERIDGYSPYLHEARCYAERMVHLARVYGNRHEPTMEMLDYWFEDKKLVRKLFEVYVPRYEKYPGSITKIWHLPSLTWPVPKTMAVLEMKGNSLPKIVDSKTVDNENCLVNILINSARLESIEKKES